MRQSSRQMVRSSSVAYSPQYEERLATTSPDSTPMELSMPPGIPTSPSSQGMRSELSRSRQMARSSLEGLLLRYEEQREIVSPDSTQTEPWILPSTRILIVLFMLSLSSQMARSSSEVILVRLVLLLVVVSPDSTPMELLMPPGTQSPMVSFRISSFSRQER